MEIFSNPSHSPRLAKGNLYHPTHENGLDHSPQNPHPKPTNDPGTLKQLLEKQQDWILDDPTFRLSSCQIKICSNPSNFSVVMYNPHWHIENGLGSEHFWPRLILTSIINSHCQVAACCRRPCAFARNARMKRTNVGSVD